MSIISNPEVLSWKHPGLGGIKTREGEIIDFPGGIPDQATVDGWVAEYEARDIDEERIDQAITLSDKDRVILATMFDHENRLRALESQPALTAAQFKWALKSRLP